MKGNHIKNVLIVEHAEGRADGFMNFIHEHDVAVIAHVWKPYRDKKPPRKRWGGIILSGGPMMVSDLKASAKKEYPFFPYEQGLVDTAYKNDVPVLGICLGAQIICDHFGGTVIKGKWIVGWHTVRPITTKDVLFREIDGNITTFQLHRDHLAVLPPTNVLLADSTNDAHEAFRLGRKRMWGCVFHPEFEVKKVQTIFDTNQKTFARQGIAIAKSALAPFDDGRKNRHRILANFFKIVCEDLR